MSDSDLKEVGEMLDESEAALIVVDELKAYDFEIISTNLPEEQEQKLREAFAHEG